MKKEDKIAVIAELTTQFTKYNNIYVSDSSGLTAAADNSFRRELHKNGIKMVIAKNTLIQKAMENSGRDFSGLFGTLKGTSALMFSDDIKAPAKAIKTFRKKAEKPSLKGAWIDSDVFLGDSSLDALINLKTKNELIGEIIGLLQSPAKNVISGLQSGGNKLAGIIKTLSERAS
jgi:large subunit ribosomal protein L10